VCGQWLACDKGITSEQRLGRLHETVHHAYLSLSLFGIYLQHCPELCHSCDGISWGSVVAAGHGKMYPHISSLGRNIIQTSGGQTQKRGIFPNRPKHVVMKATGILPTMYIIYSHLYTICSPFPLIAIIVANTDVILHPPNCHAMPGFIRNAYLPRHHIAERGLYSVLCGYVWAEMVNSNQYLIISAATLATCDYHILITCS
jgi:hypothetical protein